MLLAYVCNKFIFNFSLAYAITKLQGGKLVKWLQMKKIGIGSWCQGYYRG